MPVKITGKDGAWVGISITKTWSVTEDRVVSRTENEYQKYKPEYCCKSPSCSIM